MKTKIEEMITDYINNNNNKGVQKGVMYWMTVHTFKNCESDEFSIDFEIRSYSN